MSAVLLESLIRIHEAHMHDGRDRYQRDATFRLLCELYSALKIARQA